MLKKLLVALAVLLLSLVFLYLLGPRPTFGALDNTPTTTSLTLTDIPSFIEEREHQTPNIKPQNETQLIWADSVRKTDYAIVYLHGFSASGMEGDPLHRRIAQRYGCNLYIPRLPEHGVSGDSIFKYIQPQEWVDAALEAVAIGKVLGEQVIIMATSTGATLATYLAAADPSLAGLIYYAPNIDLYDKKSYLLNGPWGEPLAQTLFGGEFREWSANDTVQAYWTTRYHLNGLHALRYLVSETMQPTTFEKVTQPLFVSYYYQDEDHQDTAISIEAIQDFVAQVSTPSEQMEVFVTASAGSHPIASSIWNPHWQEVEEATASFLERVLRLVPVF